MRDDTMILLNILSAASCSYKLYNQFSFRHHALTLHLMIFHIYQQKGLQRLHESPRRITNGDCVGKMENASRARDSARYIRQKYTKRHLYALQAHHYSSTSMFITDCMKLLHEYQCRTNTNLIVQCVVKNI